MAGVPSSGQPCQRQIVTTARNRERAEEASGLSTTGGGEQSCHLIRDTESCSSIITWCSLMMRVLIRWMISSSLIIAHMTHDTVTRDDDGGAQDDR